MFTRYQLVGLVAEVVDGGIEADNVAKKMLSEVAFRGNVVHMHNILEYETLKQQRIYKKVIRM